MTLRGACGSVLLGIAAALSAPIPTTAQALSSYDDFSSATIDGDRWYGYLHTVGVGRGPRWNNAVENPATRHPRYSTSNATSIRRIVSRKLQLQLESLGGTHRDPDVAPGHGRLGVFGRRGSGGTVRARVTPVTAEAPWCGTTGESRVRAQLFANVADQSYVDDRDVFATLSLDRSSLGGDRIYAVVSRCRDYTCDVAEDIDWVIFDRSWALGAAHTLTIRNDPDNNRVVFTVAGGGVPAESRALRSQPVSERTIAGNRFGLLVETTPSNCPERIGVTMDARFDDVRVAAP
jgi:hypothetical protein